MMIRDLALPDEVWNFRRGDGIEKALLLADFLIDNDNTSDVSIEIENKKVHLNHKGIFFISHHTSHSESH